MVRRCPHCKTQVGELATTCWKCKLPLDYYDPQLKEVDHKEREGAKNIGKLIIVPFVMVTILTIIVVLIIVVGGDFYLLILLIYVGLIAFGFLLKKSWKAEKIMELNKMDLWEDYPILAARGRILTNIFTAQKLPEWVVKKSELVGDTVIIIFNFILWILLIILIRFQGPDFFWWSHFSPLIELFTIYILYPIFLVLIMIIYFNDIKIYKSIQL